LANDLSHRQILETLKNAIAAADIEEVQRASREVVDMGISPALAINGAMVQGMNVVGEKFQAGEYFLLDLIVAGEAMQEGLKILEPHLKETEAKIGRIILGTVEGDFHSIGKDVVKMLLKATGFDVVDLGEDVQAAKFVEASREQEPMVLGMSSLITPTMPEMGKVIQELEKAGLRRRLRVIVGGAPVSREYAERIGADAYAPDAVTGVNTCKGWALEGGR
jgi:5-methyltetrahydrofolate--homocysteine methyltransferase